jgi:hypothetical protein
MSLKFVRLMNEDCFLHRIGSIRPTNCLDCWISEYCFKLNSNKEKINVQVYDKIQEKFLNNLFNEIEPEFYFSPTLLSARIDILFEVKEFKIENLTKK